MAFNSNKMFSLGAKTSSKPMIAFARCLDAVLACVFGYLAFTSETTGFQIFWGVSALLCTATAIKSPIEKIHQFGFRMFLRGKRG